MLVEQTFHPEPTFPQGFRYLMVPFVSEGPVHQADMSAVR